MLNDLEVFLGDEMPIGVQTKLIPSWSGKHEIGNVYAKVVGAQAAWYVNRREGPFADDLVFIKVYQLNFECVPAFRIRERKVDADLRMLAGKRFSPEVRESSDDAFLSCQAIDDDGVTD